MKTLSEWQKRNKNILKKAQRPVAEGAGRRKQSWSWGLNRRRRNSWRRKEDDSSEEGRNAEYLEDDSAEAERDWSERKAQTGETSEKGRKDAAKEVHRALPVFMGGGFSYLFLSTTGDHEDNPFQEPSGRPAQKQDWWEGLYFNNLYQWR